MNEEEMAEKIIEKISVITGAIKRGKDVEIVKTSYGIVIKEISKKKLA